jgi:TRAP-type C4-dicarboxylate transport system permease small subunit
VPITGAFEPTQNRNWVIDFWTLDVKWVFVALPFGFLMMLLFYYDHVSPRYDLKFTHANLSQ